LTVDTEPVATGLATSQQEPERWARPLKSRLGRLLIGSDLLGIVIPVVFVGVTMSVLFPGFASRFNVDALLATIAVTGIVGLAQASVLAVGQFNLALPAMGAFTGMVLGWLLQVAHLDWPLAVGLAIVFAAFLGFVQGLIVAWLRLNAFIVTLGLGSAYYGAMFVILGNERFQHIGTALPAFGRGGFGAVPDIFFASMIICIVLWVLARFTVSGRWLLATGANQIAARFSALPVDRIVIGAHATSGALAGIAAILLVSRLAVGSPAIGEDWLLSSFAAPVLGGTLLSGGKISVFGTLLGTVLLAMIGNALVIVGVSQYWYQAGLGLIILGAVSVERLRIGLVAAGRL
jgi:ribose transport system permease protein